MGELYVFCIFCVNAVYQEISSMNATQKYTSDSPERVIQLSGSVIDRILQKKSVPK